MTNTYYTPTGTPATASVGASSALRAELALVSAGFDKMPILSGNSGHAIVVNGGATGMTTTTGALALSGDFTTTGAFNTTLAQSASVTLTLPAVSGTVATLAGVESLTNKTFTASNLWQGTLIAPTYGGTGSSGIPTAGQIPIGNGSSYSPGMLTGPGNVSVTSGTTLDLIASPTISGDLTVTGQISVRPGTGAPIFIGTDASNANIILGAVGTQTPYIEMRGGGVLSGYSIRMVTDGANVLHITGPSGTATLYLAGLINVAGSITASGVITAGSFGSGPAQNVGFYGSTGTTQQAITGAKAGNTALASLITKLAGLGLITDSTT